MGSLLHIPQDSFTFTPRNWRRYVSFYVNSRDSVHWWYLKSPSRTKSKSAGLKKNIPPVTKASGFMVIVIPSWLSIRCIRSIPCTINLDKPSNPGGNAVNANPRFRGIKAVEYIIPYCVATEQFLHQGEFMWRDVNHVNGVNRFSANSFKVKLPEV